MIPPRAGEGLTGLPGEIFAGFLIHFVLILGAFFNLHHRHEAIGPHAAGRNIVPQIHTLASLSFLPFIMFLSALLNFLSMTAGDLKMLPAGILSGIAALWSASRGTLALIHGLNAVYRHKETRNYIKSI